MSDVAVPRLVMALACCAMAEHCIGFYAHDSGLWRIFDLASGLVWIGIAAFHFTKWTREFFGGRS